jgi:hypothetical protein
MTRYRLFRSALSQSGFQAWFIKLVRDIAAIIGGKIVWQASPSAPLMNFDLLGYVVVAVIIINIYCITDSIAVGIGTI